MVLRHICPRALLATSGAWLLAGLACGPVASLDRAEPVDGPAQEASPGGEGGLQVVDKAASPARAASPAPAARRPAPEAALTGKGERRLARARAPGGRIPPVDVPPLEGGAAETPVLPTPPALEVSHNGGAFGANLTSLGTLDWMHFGLGGDGNVNRKRNVPALISMRLLGTSNAGHYDDRPIVHSWSDGTPTRNATDAPDGIVVGDVVGRGFEIRVPGRPDQRRTVKVYVGAWGARARLTAELSDDSAPAYSDRSLSVQHPGGDLVYNIGFQPGSAGQSLVVRWTVDTINREFGNVTLQAVTLAE